MKTIKSIDELRSLQGQTVGVSGWFDVTQDKVYKFADATGDHQWIHVDQEKAKQGPFGTTIAHGYMTLSLIPALAGQISAMEGIKMAINYGVNKVRFPNPVRIPSRVRATSKLVSVEDVQGGVQVINEVTIEIDGQEKPACVAETVARYYV